jgi:hypothetical protein
MKTTTHSPQHPVQCGRNAAGKHYLGTAGLALLTLLGVLLLFASPGARAANILYNGNFNLPAGGAIPTGWTATNWSNGWANHENNVGVTYDGSYYIVCGGMNNGTGGGGFYQTVAGTGGDIFTLSVLSGADAWWLPYGEMRMFFLDASSVQIGSAVRGTVDPAVYGNNYDIAHPWANYTLIAVAPPSTAFVKVEFAEPNGTGSVWFDNAILLQSNSSPALSSAVTLPFTVYPPASQTNAVRGITDNKNGAFTLNFLGTVGAMYCVQMTTNLMPPINWQPLTGSTNIVTNSSGLWFYVATNTDQQRFYRSAVANP